MQFIGSHHLIGSLPGEERGPELHDRSRQHEESLEPVFASLILLSLAMLSLALSISSVS
ncbi:hypothetical protein L1D32_04200 [Shewanella insulae]|uniref:hypothetical protein n=1 Tax=Shewanella insulae TaxID=2681496 RepID=UPI001EFD307C|nr:hypothetical protein [Shewanella insulae]MCG9713708.1 hypothetical protein [Shewanella insulae]MCG9737360.1 hypothetical protein [Shewanella insulae]MCG9755960.1 hypothetical protein [Shewanella insulae]